MAESDDKKPEAPPVGGEVVSLDEARKRAEEKQAPPPPNAAPSFLEPVMAAIAKEMAQIAGEGKLAGDPNSPEAQQAKTQALLKGLGEGLGAALGQLFSKWAGGVTFDIKGAPPTPATPPTPPATPTNEDPNKPKG